MKYDKLLKEVRVRAQIDDRDEAERTVLFVLQALCDRLTGEEADDLLAQLPAPLKDAIHVTETATRWSANEFVELIAGELGISTDEARKRIRAVFEVLAEAVTPGEFHDVLSQLPSGFLELLVERAPQATTR